MITGETLIGWGFNPGPWFADALKLANALYEDGCLESEIIETMQYMAPTPPAEVPYRTNPLPFDVYLDDDHADNYNAVIRTMNELMRTPTLTWGAVMPDACPAGTIPVGAIVAAKDAIHPGFHSSDVCCSMAITVFKRQDDPKRILDIAENVTHFGPGGRSEFNLPEHVAEAFERNQFLHGLSQLGDSHMGTQGDGNHFLFVGTLRSTGQPAIVTHHGSRGVGAELYRRGIRAARKHTSIVSPRTPGANTWLDANSDDGRAYWEALQLVREWTKWNHFMIHYEIQQQTGNTVADRFWNEHNFVFRKSDGLYYHAKGATPSYHGFSADDDGRTLIPMNMAEPILLARHTGGWAPHGAGRNMSRTQFLRENPELELPKGIDVRSYQGKPDLSELPGAYKSATQVIAGIEKHNLASIDDYVDPYGCIMAGERR